MSTTATTNLQSSNLVNPNNAVVTTQEVQRNVFLNVKKMEASTPDGAHTIYVYSIDVKEISIIDVTLDFSEGFNIQVENAQDMKIQATVQPMQSDTVAVVRGYDETWANPCRVTITKRSPPIEEQRTYIKNQLIQLERDVQKNELFWKDFPLKSATIDQIKEKLITQGLNANFIDIDFPPLDKSIQDPSKGLAFDRLIHWRRPKDFMEVDTTNGQLDPQVFSRIDPNDIQQGQLADSWFLCALSNLAERPALIERLFITKQYNDYGLYHLRICKNGEWQDVIIDDYIPCYPNGGPIFSRNNGSDLWVMLLEKAYAKLHGGYKNLTGGKPFHALMDLSGCPTMSLNFNDAKVKEMIGSGKLWKLLKHFSEESYIIAAGTPVEEMWFDNIRDQDENRQSNNGLVPGFAYSIIQAKEYKSHKLIQIRNPWGNFEWNGDWSNTSDLWTQEMVDVMKPTLDSSDGTFWMNFNDYAQNFSSLDVCRVRNWEECRMRGRFVRFQDAENATFDYVQSIWIYALDVPRKSHVILTLNQEDERIEGVLPRRSYIDIGLAILKMDKEQGSSLHMHKDYQVDRSIEIEMVLEPGQYMIVPRTTGVGLKKPDTTKDLDLIRFLDQQGNLHPLLASTISDIFQKFDVSANQLIELKEFKAFYEIIGKPLNAVKDENTFKEAILNKFNSTEQGITLRGFYEWWKQQIIAEGDPTIWEWMVKLGYDRDLNSLRSRVFTATVQSRNLEIEGGSIECRVRDAIPTDIDSRVNEMLIEAFGKEYGTGDNYKLLGYQSPSTQAITLGIKNLSATNPQELTLDLNECEDDIKHNSKSRVVKKVIKPNEIEFMMHIIPGKSGFNPRLIRHSVKELPAKK